jgi:hypothetical protein
MEIEIARLKKEARLTDKKIGQKARAEGLVSTADKLAAWLPEGDKTKRWTACAVGTILQGFIRDIKKGALATKKPAASNREEKHSRLIIKDMPPTNSFNTGR